MTSLPTRRGLGKGAAPLSRRRFIAAAAGGIAAALVAGGMPVELAHADGAPASGYQLTLVLPQNGLSDPKACQYPGNSGGFGWVCARDSFDATAVTPLPIGH